jgi:hypothetical protein
MIHLMQHSERKESLSGPVVDLDSEIRLLCSITAVTLTSIVRRERSKMARLPRVVQKTTNLRVYFVAVEILFPEHAILRMP